jgi:hypothetical protein
MNNMKKMVILLILVSLVYFVYCNRENFGTGYYHHSHMKGIRDHQKKYLSEKPINLIPTYTKEEKKIKEGFTVKNNDNNLSDYDLNTQFNNNSVTTLEYPTLLSNYSDEKIDKNIDENYQENMLESLSFLESDLGKENNEFLENNELYDINQENINDNLKNGMEAKKYYNDVKNDYIKKITELRNRGGNSTIQKC